MKQVYHPTAVTNVHIRRQIKESSLTNFQLAQTFHTSPATISKWKNRETCQDKSSRPHKIVYALNELEESLVVSVRKTTWLPLDEVWEMPVSYTHLDVYKRQTSSKNTWILPATSSKKSTVGLPVYLFM